MWQNGYAEIEYYILWGGIVFAGLNCDAGNAVVIVKELIHLCAKITAGCQHDLLLRENVRKSHNPFISQSPFMLRIREKVSAKPYLFKSSKALISVLRDPVTHLLC